MRRHHALKRRYGRSSSETPEAVLFARWVHARRMRDRSTGARRRHFYVLADQLQYELQDMSSLGHRMVWGSEYAKQRGER